MEREHSALHLAQALLLRQEICQYSMRPTYSERVLDRSTFLQQGMKAQILTEIFERTKVPNVRIAENVTQHSTIACRGRDVKAFLNGDHCLITPEIFASLIQCVVCGARPDGNPNYLKLRNIATDITEFFFHPNEKGSVPAFFQSPRAFVPSPFDYSELAMAIAWMRREAAVHATTGVLVFTTYEDDFPQRNKEVMAATRRVAESGQIRVEFIFPKSEEAAGRSAQFVASTLLPKGGDNVIIRPLPDAQCHMLSPLVSHVYRSFATIIPNERMFIVRNEWAEQLKQPLTWVASNEETQRFSRWLASLESEKSHRVEKAAVSDRSPDDRIIGPDILPPLQDNNRGSTSGAKLHRNNRRPT